ncbi:hypothetical protein [Hymenobacter sp. DG25A]|uniref:hypothetical protein n=1 Tax=Hymenobacter sp. DG25A TaxID=1385663 RepID=UPI0012F74FFC|nr:hypothetical protein [Hymenobacter sp. DG25A]
MALTLLAGCQEHSSTPPLTTGLPNPASSGAPDTASINQTVRGFYRWYASMIEQDQTTEFQPIFAADTRGMMTLDLTRYLANLRRLHFSEKLIQSEKDSYNTCINNLRTIPFTRRDSVLADVVEYENRDCAFFDSYRWTKTMDVYNGIQLLQTLTDGDSAKVKVMIYEAYPDSQGVKKRVWETPFTVQLVRTNETWQIDDIR